MMIIVFGDEESQIQDAKPYLQAWMQRRPFHKPFIVSIQTPNELHSFFSKRGQDAFNRVRVVICVMRLAILHIGGDESFASGVKIIQARRRIFSCPKRGRGRPWRLREAVSPACGDA